MEPGHRTFEQLINTKSQPSSKNGPSPIGQQVGRRRDPVTAKQLIELDACGEEEAQERSQQEGVAGAGREAAKREVAEGDEDQEVRTGLNEHRRVETQMIKGYPLDIVPMRSPVELRPG